MLYNLFIKLYGFSIRVSSLFSSKASLWFEGRKNWEESLIKQNVQNSIWFHCASLGEFEQARPIIEKIKESNPNEKILVTFFSPSGYELRKNYGEAIVSYLPLDTKKNASNFFKIVQPKASFLVKYEFWFNFIDECKKRSVPLFLLSGVFRKDQLFFKPIIGFYFKKKLSAFQYFFLQNESSLALIKKLGYTNAVVSKDTRFDRVNKTLKELKPLPKKISDFANTSTVVVLGSSWKEEEEIYHAFLKQHNGPIKTIIAPHDISPGHIKNIEKLFEDYKIAKYSENNDTIDAKILIIDNIGLLSQIYKVATISFVGGAFGKGLHNILEPATFGTPIIFGPKIKKFQEATDLISCGGAFIVNNQFDFNQKLIYLLEDHVALSKAQNASRNYVVSNLGATDIVYNHIKTFL